MKGRLIIERLALWDGSVKWFYVLNSPTVLVYSDIKKRGICRVF